jgi:phosphatidylethanolamine/phosphatidyl-N-methylethanolamine N-methyltransferase
MPKQIDNQRIYRIYSRFYDAFFGPFFYQGQRQAVKMMNIRPHDRVLEVGVGTGALLPFYPRYTRLMGIDLSPEMLGRAELARARLGLNRAKLLIMDAQDLQFPEASFDKVIAAYVVSVVPDPARMVAEMKRVCKKGGELFFINHFKSEGRILGAVESAVTPLCEKLGFSSSLDLYDLLARTQLKPVLERRVNLLKLWRIVKCINE